MQVLIDTYKNTGALHHAYCIYGDRARSTAKLIAFIEETLNFATIGNPDFWKEEFDSFGIHDGRRIKEVHATKAFRTDSRKIFIISTNTITREAQNSLLKMFEEPGEGNHFFVIVPSASILLPTLRSRVVVIEGGRAGEARAATSAQLFIESSLKTRMEIVKELLNDVANETKTKADILLFLNEVERSLHSRKPAASLTPAETHSLSELLIFGDYLNDRSSSPKMILEHLALTLPR